MVSEYPTKDGAGNTIVAREFGNRAPDNTSGGLTATTASDAIVAPPKGNDICNVHMAVWGAFVGSVDLERSDDDGATWEAVYTANAPDDQIYEEAKQGAQFRMNCTAYTSGTIEYNLSVR